MHPYASHAIVSQRTDELRSAATASRAARRSGGRRSPIMAALPARPGTAARPMAAVPARPGAPARPDAAVPVGPGAAGRPGHGLRQRLGWWLVTAGLGLMAKPG
ncbi:MAG: hypothetical protein ACRD0L_00260 [Acidimicrobiales bacterium]